MPVWATLLALEDEGEVTHRGRVGARDGAALVGVRRASGAFVREGGEGPAPRRLRVSAIDQIEDAQLSYGGLEVWRATGRLDGLLALSGRCWRTRGFGDFWQYMLVADGSGRDLRGPDRVAVGPGRADAGRAGGGRPLHRLHGAATAAGGDAIASNGRLHDVALAALSG